MREYKARPYIELSKIAVDGSASNVGNNVGISSGTTEHIDAASGKSRRTSSGGVPGDGTSGASSLFLKRA